MKKLCKAWSSATLLMATLPNKYSATSRTLPDFQDRVRIGMKTIFNCSVYEGKIEQTDYLRSTSKVKNEIDFFLLYSKYHRSISFYPINPNLPGGADSNPLVVFIK